MLIIGISLFFALFVVFSGSFLLGFLSVKQFFTGVSSIATLFKAEILVQNVVFLFT